MTATSSPDPTAGFSYRLPGLLLMSFLLTWIPACSRAGGASGQSLGELLNLASKANIQHDIEAEEGYLRKALEAVGPNREKAQARRELARTRWKFHRDFEEASRLLSEAADIPAEPAKTWVERAEMELARPNHQAAREAAERAVELAETSFESRAAVVALGKVTVAENVLRRLNHQSIDRESLSKVQQSLQNMVAEAVGDLEASELALTASILLGRGSDAWLAWRSYYHVIQLEFAPSLLAKPAIRLEKILLNWKRGNSSPEDRRALIHALADTRFFQEAALVALDPAGIESDSLLQEARVREIVGYAEFCREIETISDEFYRKTAIGKGERQAYTISIKKAVSELWLHLNDPGPAPPIFGSLSQIRPTLDRELGPRFGSHIRPGNSSGYYGMHFGHEIARDKKTARQYGHSASVTYTVLDRMVSNGFQSWARNDEAQTGGWATATSMVAVRQVLLSEITSIWNTFASSQERSDLEEKMKKDSASDDDRARQNPAGYLPGLKFRLAFRMVNELLDELRQSGVQESEMRMAFLGKLLRLGSAGGIFAHEGRHAIDKNIDSSLKSPELEFRAKLSEVAFSPRPRWMIISLLSPNIGDSTPHGQANQRVMRGIISWMKEHSEEIERLDQSRPMLPQLDLLTDDQVVSAMRSMDPLAKNQ